jgi:hypothetical protein
MNPAMTTNPRDVPFSGTEIANTVLSNTVSLDRLGAVSA